MGLQVSAGSCHTVLLRSDGHAVAVGLNSDGQCNMPELVHDAAHVDHSSGVLVRQLLCKELGAAHVSMSCFALTGEEICKVVLPAEASIESAQRKIAQEIGVEEK